MHIRHKHFGNGTPMMCLLPSIELVSLMHPLQHPWHCHQNTRLGKKAEMTPQCNRCCKGLCLQFLSAHFFLFLKMEQCIHSSF